MAEERIPAGWYPDPSGLPQLRWWDNHKWTEFVSDSQVEQQAAEAAVQARIVEPAVEKPVFFIPTFTPEEAAFVAEQPAFLTYEPTADVTPEPTPEPAPADRPAERAASWTDLIEPPLRTEPDPLDALFAASATSPVGVGTGETVGEAVMRALQTA